MKKKTNTYENGQSFRVMVECASSRSGNADPKSMQIIMITLSIPSIGARYSDARNAPAMCVRKSIIKTKKGDS